MTAKYLNSPAGEKEVTKAIASEWFKMFDGIIESDVLIAGAGPSGLVCGRELARRGLNVVIIESNNYLGGGFWLGGYLMNKLTVREPSQEILAELGVSLKETSNGLYVADAPEACSKLIASACDAGAKFLNMTSVDDVVMTNERVCGLVINWTPIRSLPRAVACLDPVAIETKWVVDATGHDAIIVKTLANRKILELPGCGPMSVRDSEEGVVEKTGEVYPGLVAIGMAVSSTYSIPRMGPTFGAMLLSGKKGAVYILNKMGLA